MRGLGPALIGVFCFLVAGFVRGGESRSPDPELVMAFSYALGAAGLVGVIAGGVAIGLALARD
jgi:hypothetical protein